MKSRALTCIFAMTLFAVLAMPVPLAAQQQPQEKKQHHHYKLIDLGTFGGSASYVNPVGNGGPYINREGEVVGSSMTAIPPRSNGNFPCPAASGVFHAMAWLDGHVTDLDSLGDPRNCANALAINDTGEMVGASENGLVDPATGSVQLRAVRWRDGEIKNLGTFGGNHSYASAINNRGQIVGFALNKIPDPLSMFAVVLGGPSTGTQTRAFLWEKGEMRDLGTLGGPDAWGIFVNESGEVAGYSYTNSTANATTGFPTVDPFLWKNGRMIDLGALGGTFGSPNALNNHGQVVGQSNLPGDQPGNFDPFLWDGKKLIDLFSTSIGGNPLTANAINDAGEIVGNAAFTDGAFDAYLWKDGVVTDLGTLAGDCYSEAFATNSTGQVVGISFSCVSNTQRTVLWEDGRIFDLNTLILRNPSLFLVETNAINDRGEIAGNGFPHGCTDFSCTHAFVLVPCEEDEEASNGCRGDDDAESNPTTQRRTASVSQAQTTAAQANLTPSEMKDRIRAFLTNRNRRFRDFPPK